MKYAKQLEKERQKIKSQIKHIEWVIEIKRTTIHQCLKVKYKQVNVSITSEKCIRLLDLTRNELLDLQQELKILEQVYK